MKTHKIKIIADINSIYSGDVEEIKDLILQIGDTGIDGITIDITKEGDDRVTKRELYIIKAFCDLAKFTLSEIISILALVLIKSSITSSEHTSE